MLTIESSRVLLKECTRFDLKQLHVWRNQNSFLQFCTPRGPVTFREFCREIRHDFLNDRHEQLMIYRRGSTEPIGTLYAFGGNRNNGTVCLSVYIDPCHQKRGYGLYATAAYMTHLFSSRGVERILFGVYSTNRTVLRSLQSIDLKPIYMEERAYVNKPEQRCILRFALADTQADILGRLL